MREKIHTSKAYEGVLSDLQQQEIEAKIHYESAIKTRQMFEKLFGDKLFDTKFRGMTILNAAIDVLKEQSPLTTQEIWRKLVEGGITSGSRKPVNNLYAILCRAQEKGIIRTGMNNGY